MLMVHSISRAHLNEPCLFNPTALRTAKLHRVLAVLSAIGLKQVPINCSTGQSFSVVGPAGSQTDGESILWISVPQPYITGM